MAAKRRFRSDWPIWREGSFLGRDVRRLYTVSRPPVQRAPSSHARWDRWSGVVRCLVESSAADVARAGELVPLRLPGAEVEIVPNVHSLWATRIR